MPPSDKRKPSSSFEGYFTRTPRLQNQYYDDASLNRVIGLFLPQSVVKTTDSDLSRFGQEVLSKKVFDWVTSAEKYPPYLKGAGFNAFGKRIDELVTSEGWRNLQDMGLREGVVAIGYENHYKQYSRMVQFIKYHLWSGSSAVATCPNAMQDGAASLLSHHLTNPSSPTTAVFSSAYKHLTNREAGWTSGQWMTERGGGSDVSATETLARYSPDLSTSQSTGIDGSPLGSWVIDGFKWFSSATDCQMTILLAQTTKGLSAFYAPMRRTIPNSSPGETELNGVRIQRLKNKLGTRALPTAELELKGMRAYLVGEEGKGVREISTMLNITRIHNAVSSVGFWGRGLAVSKAFVEVREMGEGRKRLMDNALHMRTLAENVLSYRGNMLLTFLGVHLLGVSETASSDSSEELSIAALKLTPRNRKDVGLLLRILTPVIKAQAAKASILGLQECMESLGGIGYLENEENQEINVARLFRDTNVLSIWEGTTDVLVTDFIKTLKGRNSEEVIRVVEEWITHALLDETRKHSAPDSSSPKSVLKQKWKDLKSMILHIATEDLLVDGRKLWRNFGAIITGVLLVTDAERDGDEVSVELCRRHVSTTQDPECDPRPWRQSLEMDRKIVFGSNGVSGRVSRL